MAYNKRYRVSHTFENGSRFISTIGVKNRHPNFPENIDGRIVRSKSSTDDSKACLSSPTAPSAESMAQSSAAAKKVDLRDHKVQQEVSAKRDRANVELPRTKLDIASNGNPSMDGVLSNENSRRCGIFDTSPPKKKWPRYHPDSRSTTTSPKLAEQRFPPPALNSHQHQLE